MSSLKREPSHASNSAKYSLSDAERIHIIEVISDVVTEELRSIIDQGIVTEEAIEALSHKRRTLVERTLSAMKQELK